jgi:TIGR03009 family protein
MYRVAKIKTWNNATSAWGKEEDGEYWVCDGQRLYELDPAKKRIRAHTLPEHLRGQGIASGPLPFLFGADVGQLQQRFWMRIVTPPEQSATQIWIEAVPRWQQDALNYQRAELILSRGELRPVGLRVFGLNGDPRSFKFEKIQTNPLLAEFMGAFKAPRKPFGWTWEDIPPPAGPPAQAQLPGRAPPR